MASKKLGAAKCATEAPASNAPNPRATARSLWRRRLVCDILDVMVAPPRHDASAHTFVTAPGGVRLSVTTYGPDTAELTVVLIHGWALSARAWAGQVDGLLEAAADRIDRSIRVLTYDHRGHGNSDRVVEGFGTVTQMADDLVCVLNEVCPRGQVVLVGHSLGGMTIMALAEQRPELFASRIAGVVLVATSAGGPDGVRSKIPGARLRLGQALARTALDRDARRRNSTRGQRKQSRPPLRPRAAMMRWLLCGPDATADQVWLSLKMLHDTPAETLPLFLSTFLTHDRIRHLSVLAELPVAILAGSHDRLTPLAESVAISRAVPTAAFTVLHRAGHMLPLERPNEVTDSIVEVINKHA